MGKIKLTVWDSFSIHLVEQFGIRESFFNGQEILEAREVPSKKQWNDYLLRFASGEERVVPRSKFIVNSVKKYTTIHSAHQLEQWSKKRDQMVLKQFPNAPVLVTPIYKHEDGTWLHIARAVVKMDRRSKSKPFYVFTISPDGSWGGSTDWPHLEFGVFSLGMTVAELAALYKEEEDAKNRENQAVHSS